jgi:hypothetical protein
MTMKVRIEDKEALDALSWRALKAYLDRTGWKLAKDLPGKGVIYKRTGPDRRLREIAVPMRRDFADYAARMGDAVGTLARAEDRSELDVYEDLRALDAKLESGILDAEPSPPAVDEATRAVHERIRKWMAEEGWDVRDVGDPGSSFHVVVMLETGLGIKIFQLMNDIDHITLSYHWSYPDDVQGIIGGLPKGDLRDAVWNIYRDVSIMGVEFTGLDTPSTEMTLQTYVYFDGLTKDTLVQRIRLTIRALMLAGRTLRRALEAQGRSDEQAPSEEILEKIVRFIPSSDHPLTAAS